MPAERNLSHAFATSCSLKDRTTSTYYEVPFEKNKSIKIDLLILTKSFGLVIETKKAGHTSGRKIQGILEDKKRVEEACENIRKNIHRNPPELWSSVLLVLYKVNKNKDLSTWWTKGKDDCASTEKSKTRLKKAKGEFKDNWKFYKEDINEDYAILYAYLIH